MVDYIMYSSSGAFTGSTNFGVVTQYTLETFALGAMWGGALSLGIQEAPAVMDYFLTYVNKLAVGILLSYRFYSCV